MTIPAKVLDYYESRRQDRRSLTLRYDLPKNDSVVFRGGCTGQGPKKLLAVDPGDDCGFAIFDMESGELEACWEAELYKLGGRVPGSPTTVRGAPDYGLTYGMFRDTIDILAGDYNIAFFAQARSWQLIREKAITAWGYFGLTSVWCADRNLSHSWHLWTTIKDWACGSQYASGDEVGAAALRRWPTRPIAKRSIAMAVMTGAYALEKIIGLQGQELPFYALGKPYFLSPSSGA